MRERKMGMIEIENMAIEIKDFLKEKEMWQTDVGLIYNGKHVGHRGTEEREEDLKGVMRIWFEGPLNHALNYGTNDKDRTIYKGLDSIMNKYGCYFEFDSCSDANVYPF